MRPSPHHPSPRRRPVQAQRRISLHLTAVREWLYWSGLDLVILGLLGSALVSAALVLAFSRAEAWDRAQALAAARWMNATVIWTGRIVTEDQSGWGVLSSLDPAHRWWFSPATADGQVRTHQDLPRPGAACLQVARTHLMGRQVTDWKSGPCPAGHTGPDTR